jgi:hypothetical protein
MHRFSTVSLFLFSISLLVAVFGVGFTKAQDNAQASDVQGNGISILPVPGESTAANNDPTGTSDENPPTITSDPETSPTVPPPQTSTTEETTSEQTTTPAPPPTSSTDSTTSEQTPPPDATSTTSSKHFTTTVVTVSGTTIHQTVPAPEPTGSNPTEAPGLNPGEKNDEDSGLDDGQKHIIIGVVVGVGGAILLGGLAVVAWRVWGRKKNEYGDEDEDMMSAGTAVGSSGRDKASSPSNAGSSPFKSTLDQYHNPGPVNAASNF